MFCSLNTSEGGDRRQHIVVMKPVMLVILHRIHDALAMENESLETDDRLHQLDRPSVDEVDCFGMKRELTKLPATCVQSDENVILSDVMKRNFMSMGDYIVTQTIHLATGELTKHVETKGYQQNAWWHVFTTLALFMRDKQNLKREHHFCLLVCARMASAMGYKVEPHKLLLLEAVRTIRSRLTDSTVTVSSTEVVATCDRLLSVKRLRSLFDSFHGRSYCTV